MLSKSGRTPSLILGAAFAIALCLAFAYASPHDAQGGDGGWIVSVHDEGSGGSLFHLQIQQDIDPGVQMLRSPRMPLPDHARSILQFQPQVSPFVHHMIVYCDFGLLYAWARTGQNGHQMGLNLSDAPLDARAGFAIGRPEGITFVSLEFHYQQMTAAPIQDESGVLITLDSAAPAYPLRVLLLAATVVIPPHANADMCTTCHVRHGGGVIGFRVHAHRFATRIYSNHHRAFQPVSRLGDQDAQQAQIFRFLDKERALVAADTLTVHCEYVSTANHTIFDGLDERRNEMCNLYLLVRSEVHIDCERTVAADTNRTCTTW